MKPGYVVKRAFWWALYVAAVERKQLLTRKIARITAELDAEHKNHAEGGER